MVVIAGIAGRLLEDRSRKMLQHPKSLLVLFPSTWWPAVAHPHRKPFGNAVVFSAAAGAISVSPNDILPIPATAAAAVACRNSSRRDIPFDTALTFAGSVAFLSIALVLPGLRLLRKGSLPTADHNILRALFWLYSRDCAQSKTAGVEPAVRAGWVVVAKRRGRAWRCCCCASGCRSVCCSDSVRG